MDIGDKIKKRRKELDLSQDQLAKKLSEMGLEMEQVTISRIEGSARRVVAEELEFFSAALQLTTEYLSNSKKDWPPSNGDRLPKAPPEVPGKIPLRQPETIGEGDTIPIISYVSAGETEVAYGDAGYPAGEGIDRMARPEGVTDPHAYGLIVKGNSMLPTMPEGTVVVVSTRIKPKEGQVVICREKLQGKVYIKLLKRLDNVVVLESTNLQDHDPLVFQREDIYFMHPVVCWNTTKIKE
ncbi:MAG: XRE family transcriptional regulator [Candidatus Brocadiales bacterium]|nr:XRE family transcriptional regulator [Candidatus Bathyanammoxibius amoris]